MASGALLMRLAHIADLHLDEKTRFTDTLAVFDSLVTDLTSVQPDLILLAGDLIGRDAPHVVTPTEREAFIQFLFRLGTIAPVIGITGNHDRVGEYRSYVPYLDQPTYPVRITEDPIAWVETPEYAVVCAPYVRMPDPETYLKRLTALTELRGPSCILLAHASVVGAKVGSWEVHAAQEAAFTPTWLDRERWAYVALGHLHQRQQVSLHGWYAGSLTPIDHSETEPKGYLLVTLDPDHSPQVEFRPIPSWIMQTITGCWSRTGGWVPDPEQAPVLPGTRLRLKVRAERGESLVHTALAQAYPEVAECKIVVETPAAALELPTGLAPLTTDLDRFLHLLTAEEVPATEIDAMVERFIRVQERSTLTHSTHE